MQKTLATADFLTRLESDHKSSADFIADSRAIRAIPNAMTERVDIQVRDIPAGLLAEGRAAVDADWSGHPEIFRGPLTDHAAGQVAQRLSIPLGYFRRMEQSSAALAAVNVNHWLTGTPADAGKRMLRTLDGEARAFLSDQYKRIDNLQVAQMIAEAIGDTPGIEFKHLQVTDKKLYMHAVSDRLRGDVAVGDEVQGGFVVRNSEVGAGSISVQPFIYRLVCLNGMVVGDKVGGYSRRHVGRRQEIESGAAVLSQEALQADAVALSLAVRDTVQAAISSEAFDKVLGRMQETTGRAIEQDPETVVERLAESFKLTEPEQAAVLRNLWQGTDRSQWGLLNAVTAVANDSNLVSFDRAVELESIGGQILDLSPTQWERVAVAA